MAWIDDPVEILDRVQRLNDTTDRLDQVIDLGVGDEFGRQVCVQSHLNLEHATRLQSSERDHRMDVHRRSSRSKWLD